MLFINEMNTPDGFYDFKESGFPLLLFKQNHFWDICLKNQVDSDGYPERIGQIKAMGAGDLSDSTKLAWKINEDYRGQGIMKLALKIFLEQCSSGKIYEVQIKKENVASLNLAKSAGFSVYKEDDDCEFLVKR